MVLPITLEQLFQRRSGHRLTLQAYHELGGVKGALAQHSEKTYMGLSSDEHRRLARALFLRLIEPGATEQDTTRRRAALTEFVLDKAKQTHMMSETIDAFVAARLLMTNESVGVKTIEVSHEAVIREWPRLASWLREAREDIPLQQAVSDDAEEWVRRGRPKDRLYRGTQLKEAQAWAMHYMVSERELAFLRASEHQQERSNLVKVTVIFLLLILVIPTGFLVSAPDMSNLAVSRFTPVQDRTVSAGDLTKVFDPQGLQNNGGQTKTYKLLPGTDNPAIDAIPPDACYIPDIFDKATLRRRSIRIFRLSGMFTMLKLYQLIT